MYKIQYLISHTHCPLLSKSSSSFVRSLIFAIQYTAIQEKCESEEREGGTHILLLHHDGNTVQL